MDDVKAFLLSVLILPALVYGKELQEKFDNNSISCPPWTTPDDNGTCQCGDSLNGVVECQSNGNQVKVVTGYCMTYSEKFNETVVGGCYYSYLQYESSYYDVFDGADQTQDICDVLQMNRTGQLCGSCKEGYALPVYSYSWACVKCEDYKYNWLKYIAVAFLPLTLLYIVVIIFKISATSGVACVYVLVLQGLTLNYQMNIYEVSLGYSSWTRILYTYISLRSLWNLDFLRGLYPPFCLHPNLSTLGTLALEYTTAVYPFILIVITYVCVKLHDHYPVVSKLWRPFFKAFRLIRREWNITTSLIEVFSTFILLVYTRIVITSAGILRYTFLYNQQGKGLGSLNLYYNANVEYFGKEHLPSAILAIVMVLVFNVLPLLILCLYPCRCFHKCLNACRFHSFLLHTFVESFQGHYKTHPRDLRYFAALYPLLRFLALVVFMILTSEVIFFAIVGVFVIVSSTLILIYRPHKEEPHNTLNAIILVWLGLILLSIPLSDAVPITFIRYALYAVGMVLELGFISYWIVPKHIRQYLKTKLDGLRKCLSRQNDDNDSTPDESSLLINKTEETSDEYNTQPAVCMYHEIEIVLETNDDKNNDPTNDA